MATLQEIIKYSKDNPTTDYAKTAYQHIKNGDFDAQAQQEGIDLTFAGRENFAQKKQLSEEPLISKVARNTANVGIGAAKGVVSTAQNLSSLMEKGVSKVTGLVPGVNEFLDIGGDKTVAEQVIPEQATKPSNASQTVGKTGEQIGEMFIPLGLEKTVASKLAEIPELAKNAPLLAQIAKNLIETGTKGLTSAVEFGGKTLAQTGDMKQAIESGIIAGAVAPVANFVKAIGKGASEIVIPTSAKEAGYLQSYKANVPFWQRVFGGSKGEPVTAAKTAFEKGLMGTESMIGVQAKRASDNLWNNLISPALKRAKAVVNIPSFFKEAEQKIIKDNPEVSRQKSLLEALDSFKEDYKGLENVTLEKLQQFKEGWAKFIPEKAYQGKSIAGAANDVRDTLADLARQGIYSKLGDTVKQAYFDYGNLKGLQELGKTAMTGGKLKGGAGSWINAVKDMALVPLGTIGGQAVYKVGQGIELFGRQGAKTVGDILNSIFSEQ